ncbi:RNA polymerase sigma factor [Abyssisolibacter fermentans]|uniref:RNA polymerase sigma factor n=1 Tax=Abyssisolibacter fermentans TaxID=1766203 RepID=UPI0008347E14|nr:sigma-70 family RNA polymerase sigma factor [Abyssisolibacter fermentans]
MVNNEEKLIKKCQKGDIDAFETLISSYEKIAYNIALKMLKNREDAMDISQEAFIKVFKSIDKFNFKSSFSTWLYRIVVNTCIDHLKKKKKVYSIDSTVETQNGEIHTEIPDTTNNPEQLMEKKLTKELVHRSINELSETHKVVIVLRDIQGFSYEEISQIIGCSQGTVKSRISRARSALKKIIINDTEQNIERFV